MPARKVSWREADEDADAEQNRHAAVEGRRITAPPPIGEACLFSVLFSPPSPNVRQNR
jgi:hypothetical protein